MLLEGCHNGLSKLIKDKLVAQEVLLDLGHLHRPHRSHTQTSLGVEEEVSAGCQAHLWQSSAHLHHTVFRLQQ